jgi:hypothetical protein
LRLSSAPAQTSGEPAWQPTGSPCFLPPTFPWLVHVIHHWSEMERSHNLSTLKSYRTMSHDSLIKNLQCTHVYPWGLCDLASAPRHFSSLQMYTHTHKDYFQVKPKSPHFLQTSAHTQFIHDTYFFLHKIWRLPPLQSILKPISMALSVILHTHGMLQVPVPNREFTLSYSSCKLDPAPSEPHTEETLERLCMQYNNKWIVKSSQRDAQGKHTDTLLWTFLKSESTSSTNKIPTNKDGSHEGFHWREPGRGQQVGLWAA